MENENLTEKDNMEMNQGDAPQPDMSSPIAGGIVSQMAIQENVAQSASGEDLEAERSLNAELNAASGLAGGINPETTSGAEQEK